MSGISAPESPLTSGLFGVLRSWLRNGIGETDPSPEVRPSQPHRPMAPSLGSVRVLVVDDDPLNLMVMSTLMGSRGLVPCLAADGAEAVALACELQFDLILMDLQMPILDGFGATIAIRRFEKQNSRPAVPVVAYSSCPPGANVLTRLGLSGMLVKPCGDRELEDCLVRWCPAYRPAPAARAPAPGERRWPLTNQALGR